VPLRVQTTVPLVRISPAAQKYHLYIGLTTSTANANLDTDTPEVCVGQLVTFGADWQGGIPPYTTVDGIYWHLPDKYVNQPINYSATCTTYVRNDNLLTNTAVQCWYVNQPGGACSVRETLHFANGQSVNIAAAGGFTVYRPKIVGFYPSTSTAVVLDTSSDIYLGLGEKSGQGSKRMQWNMDVEAKPTYSGWITDLQLVDSWDTHDGIFDDNTPGDDFWLDGSIIYAGDDFWRVRDDSESTTTIHHSDTPSIDGNFTSLVEKTDSFWTYVQFQPDGGIPITIGIVTWGWHGKATADDSGVWSLNIQDITPPFLYSDDDTFPEWSNIFLNTH
jgi:hypothetical protein